MSAFILKIIALSVMFVDHTGAVFYPLTDVTLLREIGRIAFPIFIFFIAEGCRQTRNIKLYMTRLGLFALISEAPFDLAAADFYPGSHAFGITSLDFMAHQNVFFTFFLGVLCVYFYQLFTRGGADRIFYIILIPIVILLGDLLHTDYGSAGVLFVFILYMLPYGRQENGKPLVISEGGKYLRIAALFCLLLYLYILKSFNYNFAFEVVRNKGLPALFEILPQMVYPHAVDYMLFGCISLFLLAFYNTKRGKPLKWLFYAAYPAHLLVLGIIRFIYVIPTALKP